MWAEASTGERGSLRRGLRAVPFPTPLQYPRLEPRHSPLEQLPARAGPVPHSAASSITDEPSRFAPRGLGFAIRCAACVLIALFLWYWKFCCRHRADTAAIPCGNEGETVVRDAKKVGHRRPVGPALPMRALRVHYGVPRLCRDAFRGGCAQPGGFGMTCRTPPIFSWTAEALRSRRGDYLLFADHFRVSRHRCSGHPRPVPLLFRRPRPCCVAGCCSFSTPCPPGPRRRRQDKRDRPQPRRRRCIPSKRPSSTDAHNFAAGCAAWLHQKKCQPLYYEEVLVVRIHPELLAAGHQP